MFENKRQILFTTLGSMNLKACRKYRCAHFLKEIYPCVFSYCIHFDENEFALHWIFTYKLFITKNIHCNCNSTRGKRKIWMT